jgi:hypothetical protein
MEINLNRDIYRMNLRGKQPNLYFTRVRNENNVDKIFT